MKLLLLVGLYIGSFVNWFFVYFVYVVNILLCNFGIDLMMNGVLMLYIVNDGVVSVCMCLLVRWCECMYGMVLMSVGVICG